MTPFEMDTLTETEIEYKIADQVEAESQVIVHCTIKPFTCDGARMWPSTYLLDKHSDHKSKLLHVENISMYPTWTFFNPREPYHFTLIFEGLPKSCILFDLKEPIPEPRGFYCPNIPRNQSDVYQVHM